MKTVIAVFRYPGDCKPAIVNRLDWANRSDVRWFAMQAETWLKKGRGFSVTTTSDFEA